MAQSNGRLYSGPLSQAAQKILVVLRAQSGHAARRNHNYYDHRQIEERNNGSQWEPWAQSNWSLSHQENKEGGTDRKYSEPPACQSSQALSFTQHEETAASLSNRDRYTLSLQIPKKRYEHQATPWRSSTEEIRPHFILNLSPDKKDHDMALFPPTNYPDTHKAQPALACHQVSSGLKISEETDNDTSGAQKKNRNAESWHIPRKKLDQSVGLDSLAKWKQPLFNPTKEVISGEEDGGILYNQSEEGVQQIVDSENRGAANEEISDQGHEMQDAATGQETRHWDAPLPHEKGSASEMQGFQFLGTNENPSLERNLNLVYTSKMDKSFHCYSEVTKSWQKEHNDFDCIVNTHEIKIEHSPSIDDKEISVGCLPCTPKKILTSSERGDHKWVHCQAESPQDVSQTVTETAEKDKTENPPSFLGDTTADNLERTKEEGIEVMEVGLEVQKESSAVVDSSIEVEIETEQHHCSDVQIRESQCETDYRGVNELPGGDIEPGEKGGDRNEYVMPPVDSENASTSTEDLGRESSPTPPLSQMCRAKRLKFRAPCLLGNHQHHDNVQTANGNVRGISSTEILASTCSFAAGQNSFSAQDLISTTTKPSKKLGNSYLPTSETHSCHPLLIPSFPLKRKLEVLKRQYADPPKIYITGHPPKWEPPYSSQEKAGEVGGIELKRAKPGTSIPELPAVNPKPQTEVSPLHKTGKVLGVHKDPHGPKQVRQIQQSMLEGRCPKSARNTSKKTQSSATCKPLNRTKCGPDEGIHGAKLSHDEANGNESQNQSKAGCLTATLTSDPRVKDSCKMNPDEKMQMLEELEKTKALVLTLVYRDGTTQLDLEQKLTQAVCGLLILMKNSLDRSTPEDTLGPNDSLVYLKLEHTPAWAQQHKRQSQELFTRDILLQVLSRSQLVVCYKAKDFLRTALQLYRQDLSWKQVAGCQIQDPQVSGWLLDPTNPSSCYPDLLSKHNKRPHTTPALGTKKVSQVISGLYSLYCLNMKLCFKLQSQGLWELYSDLELNMISVLAAMESHHIYVDKEALKRTSDLLGAKMKQLEQEAHRAAGQIFMVTSNTQLRTVLFEKLCLHKRCENKKLPKTINKQQQSTSEAALLQLQDLHPLPKIILEYRQVHKIKSTFVDGILSCMMSKNYVSSTWYQTSSVTGRISAKHPNFQALPRQPLQITKKQYIEGKEEEVVTVHPRAMFIPQEGWTFLAADFCQVELRLLAHLSSDPELLRIFTNPQADVFTMLASQWKGVSEGEVTSEDREHAKRIVYSVVYGAGRERLSGILGVSTEQASRFQDSFLQTYREVHAFIQRTIQQCHKQGYVLSIMGRRRTFPNINAPDWGIRMQAERQAVNFVVQGSAADLCKMAMIRIFKLVSSSSSCSARLIAQLHDELLYEVEDSQVEQFADLVRSTMESLQHIDHLGVHLKVPLKVAVSSGKSWGSMSELNIPPMSPSL
ncbi:DNA polymerase nu isoform X2 [Etheostoma cragini]|uniref:DNA polymerase nu isoform X2 n=1 Tax=Etheostoma cragini TaxID=417921 RepID=UPI00155F251B|nr:DNA polymerase nu isoform X2 [Etheostoma cragini]